MSTAISYQRHNHCLGTPFRNDWAEKPIYVLHLLPTAVDKC